eukprot:GILJ01016016.1.p1 GENE.GILJ01016016.1~~GILJ01016016.1.p1  ORF type:complete len:180 (+),score=34.92 GILJ01016016.1:55-540(+)
MADPSTSVPLPLLWTDMMELQRDIQEEIRHTTQARESNLSGHLYEKDGLLRLAREENSMLQERLAQEKESAQRTFHVLRQAAQAKSNELQLAEKEIEVLKTTIANLSSALSNKEAQVQSLTTEMEKKEREHQLLVSNMELRHEQEMFIARKMVEFEVRKHP